MKRIDLVLIGCLVLCAPALAERTLLRCEIDGKVTYSDQACLQATNRTEVATEALNTYSSESTDTASMRRDEPRRKTSTHRGESIAETQIRHRERCKELAQKIDALGAKIWAQDANGHKARNNRSDHLREQQEKLEGERKAEKCR